MQCMVIEKSWNDGHNGYLDRSIVLKEKKAGSKHISKKEAILLPK